MRSRLLKFLVIAEWVIVPIYSVFACSLCLLLLDEGVYFRMASILLIPIPFFVIGLIKVSNSALSKEPRISKGMLIFYLLGLPLIGIFLGLGMCAVST